MAQHSAFSFHCMICFEEFHPEERFPVVLPCGHTYVCNVCANRLDKCMECRIPLFTTVRPGGAGNGGAPGTRAAAGAASHHGPGSLHSQHPLTRTSWANARSSGGVGAAGGVASDNAAAAPQTQKAQPPVKKRLPLPKNVVLLSLIEATELATQDVQKKYSEEQHHLPPPPPGGSGGEGGDDSASPSVSARALHLQSRPSVFTMNSMIDADDDEEEKIRVGTSLAVGVAGTYAVAAREGLTIVSSRPPPPGGGGGANSSSSSSRGMDASLNSAEEDVDSLVRNINHRHHDRESPKKSYSPKSASLNNDDNEASETASNSKDSCKLSFGDRVQVVSIDNGWAKLARGYGYVSVQRNSLVKVGGAVDRACKVEAMLRNLSQRRKELRLEQSRIDNQFIRLMNDLQLSLQNDEDLTVIAADAFSEPAHREAQAEPYVEMVAAEKKEDEPAASSSTAAAAAAAAEQRNDCCDAELVKPARMPQPLATTTSGYARPSLMCFAGDVFAGYSSEARENAAPSSAPTSPALSIDALASLFPSASHPSPSALRAGAQAWRERHGRQANQGIDFRTGLSGHMALLSSHAHPHEYLEPVSSYSSASGYNFPKMSSHTGLTMFKPSKGRGLLASLTLPSFGLSPQPDDGTRDGVQPTGSM